MKGFKRLLPKLDALVYFEAAARLNSFTEAGTELYVTQAAVSKRIADLESRLNVKLFHRQGRRLTLTPIGRRIHEQTSMALEFIDAACRLAQGHATETIRVAGNSAVSLFWLAPRLRAFGLSDDSTSVNLFTSDNVSETLDPENDLVVIYGHGDTPGWTGDLLFHEHLVPVASPGYISAAGIDPRSDLSGDLPLERFTLLEYERIAPDWINWSVWRDRAGSQFLRRCKTRPIRNYAQAIGAALRGQGLALGSLGLIDAELESGRLCTIGNIGLSSGRAYYLVRPRRKKLSSSAELLRRMLLQNEQA